MGQNSQEVTRAGAEILALWRVIDWKTARLDARFKERAEQVLWCYANAARLAEQGIWVVCVDEIPTFQVLERKPIRRAIPGRSSNRSSTTSGMGRSTCWCSWWSIAV